MKKLILLTMLTACGDAYVPIVGPQGPQGSQGPAGEKGDAGADGQDGQDGQQGPAGADGTVITVVQFCPNHTPNYPSTFPEFGLCIEGQLYAVYSTNGGFLALIPPGTYSSNAVGSACTFTVSAGCVVQ